MDVLYIVMPAYNEEANIEQVIEEWYPLLKFSGEKSRLVIDTTGSEDRTSEIISKLRNEGYEFLEEVKGKYKEHGPKLIELYKYAISNGVDFIFQTDSDGQTNPKEFEEFWLQRNEYDAIIGNRIVREDGRGRKFVENVVCFLLYIYFGVGVRDANAPFRLMNADMLRKYIDKLPEDFNIPNIMFTTYFVYYKEKILFKEISFKTRCAGENKINIKKIFRIGWKAIGDFKRLKKEL